MSKHLKNQMANLTEDSFRHTLTKLRVEGAASKKKAAKASLLDSGGSVTGHRDEGASRSNIAADSMSLFGKEFGRSGPSPLSRGVL